MVKSLPIVQETWVQSLGWEDHCKREWQPTPAFLSGESHGQRGLAGYSPWGRNESDANEHTDNREEGSCDQRDRVRVRQSGSSGFNLWWQIGIKLLVVSLL